MATTLVVGFIFLLSAPFLYKFFLLYYYVYFSWALRSAIPFKIIFKPKITKQKQQIGFCNNTEVAKISNEILNKRN